MNRKFKCIILLFLFLFLAATIVSISVYATSSAAEVNLTDSHLVDETYVFLEKETGNGLDAYYGYWAYDGSNPVQIDYRMNLFYPTSSSLTTTVYMEFFTVVNYRGFLGIPKSLSHSVSVGRNDCLNGTYIRGYYTGPEKDLIGLTTVYTNETSTYGEEIWTINGN